MLKKLRGKIDKRLLRFRRLLQVISFSRRRMPCWQWRYPQAVSRGYQLYRREGFMPEEAFRLGLLSASNQDSSRFISKKQLCRLQERLNPAEWRFLVRDKGIFYRYCQTLGIPIPELFAIYFRTGAGWTANGAHFHKLKDWLLLMTQHLPAEFIVKPATGTYSQGLNLFYRHSKGFRDFSGGFYLAEDIIEWMNAESRFDSFVIQARLANHAELIRLSGTQCLQTVRIITIIDDQGKCCIVHAHFKPIVGPYLSDTHLEGLEGNVEAAVDLASGRLIAANRLSGNGVGIVEILAHPETGLDFAGFPLPLWEDACRLVMTIAPKFLPLRSIGWDVALTPQGPVLVEGNSCWDPPNQHRCMPAMVRQIDQYL